MWIGKVVTQYHPEELLEIAEREESIYLKDLTPKRLLPRIQWVVLHPNYILATISELNGFNQKRCVCMDWSEELG